MRTDRSTPTRIRSIADFPENYFLENLAVRRDGSIVVTALNRGEVWCVPAPTGIQPGEPVLVATLEQLAMGIVETEPDVFVVCTLGDATLQRLDFRGWRPGDPVKRSRILTFEPAHAGLNGCCLIAPDVVLIADCVDGLIWRVDLASGGGSATATPWLRHESMAGSYTDPFAPVQLSPDVQIPMPGVNGVRYAPDSGQLYYTCSAEQLFMRVAVDPDSHQPAGDPELVAEGIHAMDDFCLDVNAGVAYITTHIDNSIHRVPLDPAAGANHSIVAGEPFADPLVGPSSIVWGRRPGDHGRVAYVTTDGGYAKLPPDGAIRPARVLRVELPAADAAPGRNLAGHRRRS